MSETKREIIKAALKYRDGNFYVGGMAMSHVCALLNAGYPPKHFDKSLDDASTHQIHEVYEYLRPYIKHMEAHPKKKCPTCGTMVDA